MKKTIQDVDVAGKKVLVRVDYNVPQDKEGNITDDTRIRATLPTIHKLLQKGASVILMSHLGRPKGEVNLAYTLQPIADRLASLLDKPVKFAEDCVGEVAEGAVANLHQGEVLLLENLRFHSEEEKNDPAFCQQLAKLADLAVNDAFGVSHRAHASVEGISKFMPMVAGLLVEKEIKFLGKALANPERPFTAIIGGAKVSDKIGVIKNLMETVDVLIIGGGMANTFLAAQGYNMGASLVETDKADLARELLEKATERGISFLLPVDFVVADRFAADANFKVVKAAEVPEGWMALDIGPESVKKFQEALKTSKTVVWNGPMGVFEMPNFAGGTMALAHTLAELKEATTIVGGGDSVAAIEKAGLANKIDHISTGGGASLEFLEGKILPGIAVLADPNV
ncbi:MAG: phosphoglycerate kinase [Negativicutes bacterium]|nr:phosphoglycerate kinase [Negativicutes bacterium]